MGKTCKNVLFACNWLWLWLASPLRAMSPKLMGGDSELAQIWILFNSSIRKMTPTTTMTKVVIFRRSCPTGTPGVAKFRECYVPSQIQAFLCSALAVPASITFSVLHLKPPGLDRSWVAWLPFLSSPPTCTCSLHPLSMAWALAALQTLCSSSCVP